MPAPDQTVAETPTPRTNALLYTREGARIIVHGETFEALELLARTLERELHAANAALRVEEEKAKYWADLYQISNEMFDAEIFKPEPDEDCLLLWVDIHRFDIGYYVLHETEGGLWFWRGSEDPVEADTPPTYWWRLPKIGDHAAAIERARKG